MYLPQPLQLLTGKKIDFGHSGKNGKCSYKSSSYQFLNV